MGKFWGSGESITKGRDGIVIREDIGPNGTGTWDIVQEELVDEVRVVSWLNERTRVSDEERRSLADYQ
jgi:hypothetical protein